jgi:ATP-dependent Clp protease ATP-binding subunit ClpA
MVIYNDEDIIGDLIHEGPGGSIVNHLMPIVSPSEVIDRRGMDELMPIVRSAILKINRSLSVVHRHKNVILAGASGSGKTFIIKQLIAHSADLHHPSGYGFYYRRFDNVLFINIMNDIRIQDAKIPPSTVVSDVIQRMLMLDEGRPDHLVLIVNNLDIAALVSTIAPQITMIVEMSSTDAERFASDHHDIIDRFEFIGLNEDMPTWGCICDELNRVENTRFKKYYASHFNPDTIVYALKIFNRLDSVIHGENARMAKGSLVYRPIEFFIRRIEYLHVWVEQNRVDLNAMNRSELRKIVTSLSHDLPSRIDHDLSNMLIEEEQEADDEDKDQIMTTEASSAVIPSRMRPLAYSDVMTLGDRLRDKVINQDAAIDEIVDSIKIDAAGIRKRDRPIATFLFDGPSGVGKTELAKQLALELFSKPVNLIRLDMSEYASKEDVTKLFGSAPGYQDSDNGGQLTNKVLKNPQSIILLDEAEKANPKVWNSFLQVFDDGRMTDGMGTTVNFTNTIIILTSNLGNKESMTSSAGFGYGVQNGLRSNGEISSIMKKSIDRYFTPELIARIDAIIMFNRLRRVDLEKIARMQINDLSSVLRSNHNGLQISGDIGDDVVDLLLDAADSDRFGAREIQKAIKKYVTLPLANWVMTQDGHFSSHDILHLKRSGNMIKFVTTIMKESLNG